MKTPQERAAEKRQEKLDQIDSQVASGELVIRQMTPEERERNPPRPPKPKQKQRPGRGR
jgi:hypothetical protein